MLGNRILDENMSVSFMPTLSFYNLVEDEMERFLHFFYIKRVSYQAKHAEK